MTEILDYKKQQALDALRKALGWCEQIGVSVRIWTVHTPTGTHVDCMIEDAEYDDSNRTLRYTPPK